MPQNGSLLVLSTFAPDVDTLLLTALKRLAGNEDLRVLRESTREIVQIVKVLIVRMVAIEPRKVRKILRLVLG
jgi:hypothetical protein